MQTQLDYSSLPHNTITEMERFDEKELLTGETARMANWDFDSMTANEFKKYFKSEIVNPLKKLLNDFNRDPNVQMPAPLKEAMLGIIRGLMNFFNRMASRPGAQKGWNLSAKVGQQATNPTVVWIHFASLEKLKKLCISIISNVAADKPINPFSIMYKSVDEVALVFSKDASFAHNMIRVRGGAVPGEFPLLISLKIRELVSTSLPDTFMETQVLDLCTGEELDRAPTETPDVSKKAILLNSINADENLRIYADRVCALCESSGVLEKLLRCEKCNFARYCGEAHQAEHWSVHKNHCKRIRELKKIAGY